MVSLAAIIVAARMIESQNLTDFDGRGGGEIERKLKKERKKMGHQYPSHLSFSFVFFIFLLRRIKY